MWSRSPKWLKTLKKPLSDAPPPTIARLLCRINPSRRLHPSPDGSSSCVFFIVLNWFKSKNSVICWPPSPYTKDGSTTRDFAMKSDAVHESAVLRHTSRYDIRPPAWFNTHGVGGEVLGKGHSNGMGHDNVYFATINRVGLGCWQVKAKAILHEKNNQTDPNYG